MTGPDLSKLSHAEKDALILTLMARLDAAMKRIDEHNVAYIEAGLTGPANVTIRFVGGDKPSIVILGTTEEVVAKLTGAVLTGPDEPLQSNPPGDVQLST